MADVASSNLEGSDIQRFIFDPAVDVAPDAALRAAMLKRMPLAFTLHLDVGAVDQQVQRAFRATVGMLTARIF